MSAATRDARRRAKGRTTWRTCAGASGRRGSGSRRTRRRSPSSRPSPARRTASGGCASPTGTPYTNALRKASLAQRRRPRPSPSRCARPVTSAEGRRACGRGELATDVSARRPDQAVPVDAKPGPPPGQARGSQGRRRLAEATLGERQPLDPTSGPGRKPGALLRSVASVATVGLTAARGPTWAPTGEPGWVPDQRVTRIRETRPRAHSRRARSARHVRRHMGYPAPVGRRTLRRVARAAQHRGVADVERRTASGERDDVIDGQVARRGGRGAGSPGTSCRARHARRGARGR